MDGEKERQENFIGREKIAEVITDADTLSLLFAVSIARVSTLARELGFEKADKKHYRFAKSIQALIAFQRSRMKAPASKSGEADKDRKTALEAEKLKMDLAERRGELIPIGAVEKEWSTLVAGIRTKILGVPVKVAPFIAPETDPAIVKDILEKFLREILNDLASDTPGDPGTTKKKRSRPKEDGAKGPENIPAPANPESVSMGGQRKTT